MSIVIEKGIPIPGRATKSAFPFAEMEPPAPDGLCSSFFVEGQKTVATKSAEKRLGFKFKTLAMNGGCRVWRIA